MAGHSRQNDGITYSQLGEYQGGGQLGRKAENASRTPESLGPGCEGHLCQVEVVEGAGAGDTVKGYP